MARAAVTGKTLARDFLFVWRCFTRTWRRRGRRVWGVTAIVFLVSGLLLFPLDQALLQWVQGPEAPWLEDAEDGLAFWGDFLQFNVTVSAILLVVGWARGDRWLQRLALAFLLGGALSGATSRVVKFSTGRARPKELVKLEKRGQLEKEGYYGVGFTGPTGKSRYHGYFSGHTAASWGSAVVLLVALPRVGWVAVLFAGAVGWSRIYGNHHFPSDVLHGMAWGLAWGYLVGGGMAVVRRRMRLLGRPQE